MTLAQFHMLNRGAAFAEHLANDKTRDATPGTMSDLAMYANAKP
jgi:hypothetical protein